MAAQCFYECLLLLWSQQELPKTHEFRTKLFKTAFLIAYFSWRMVYWRPNVKVTLSLPRRLLFLSPLPSLVLPVGDASRDAVNNFSH